MARRPPIRPLVLALLASVSPAPGCAVPRVAATPVEGVLDAETGRAVTFEEMVADLATVRVVYVGESHTNPEHHEIQGRVIGALAARYPRLLVGMEMLQRPYQEILDRWSAGEMEEEEFVREVQWYDQWSNWNLYAPILRLARERRLRVVALNVDRAIIREVNRRGLADLPVALRVRIPGTIDTSVKAHEKSIREVFFGHPGMDAKTSEERFRRFYEAQCTWDETMAETAVDALAAGPPGAAIVVLAGSMHVKGFLAMPERARRRNGLDYRVVLPMERDAIPEGGFPLGMGRPADYVIFTGPTPTAPPGILGVALRSGDATVKQVAEGSAAAAAGLREGDVLLEVGGIAVIDAVDLKLALDGLPPGTRVPLRWRRGGEVLEGGVPLGVPPPMFPPPAAPKPEGSAEEPAGK